MEYELDSGDVGSTRHCLLSLIIAGNAQSLCNKLDELGANVKNLHEYRNCSFMCFSETCGLRTHRLLVRPISMALLVSVWIEALNQEKHNYGGGVCIYVNQKWCNNICVKKNVFAHRILSFWLLACGHTTFPENFPNCSLPPFTFHLEQMLTMQLLLFQELSRTWERQSPDAVQLIMGDFSGCSLDAVMPHYHQYVNIPTRGQRTLDKCYGNIPNACQTFGKAPLGKSDHNMVYLLPKYKQKLKQDLVIP